MEYIIDPETHKCAHEQCKCQVSSTLEYCSDYCSEAADLKEVELQCDCSTLHVCWTERRLDQQSQRTPMLRRK